MRRIAFAVPVLLLVVGCDGAPARPEPKNVDELTKGALTDSAAQQTAFVNGGAGDVQRGWLRTFEDAQLTELVAEAMANSREIAQVAARLEQAQAKARQAGADLGPTIGYAVGAAGSGAANSKDLNQGVGAGLSLSWEADIWGRISSQNAAVSAQAQASALDLAWARESMAANVAKALFLARLCARQEAINRTVAELQQRLVAIQEKRQTIGQATAMQVQSAKAELADANNRQKQSTAAREEAVRSLEVLLGRYPKADLPTGDVLPKPPEPPPAGLPSQLLERRPDLIAATRRVASAFNQVESAKAAQLPRLSFTVSGGAANGDFQNMNVNGLFWQAVGNFVGPLYDGGRLKEQVVIETARQDEALALFGAASLKAFREVEEALAEDARLAERVALTTTAENEQAEAERLATLRFEAGVIDQLALILVQSRTLEARLAALAMRVERLTNRVDLHLALGGGFAAPPPAPEDELPASKVVPKADATAPR